MEYTETAPWQVVASSYHCSKKKILPGMCFMEPFLMMPFSSKCLLVKPPELWYLQDTSTWDIRHFLFPLKRQRLLVVCLLFGVCHILSSLLTTVGLVKEEISALAKWEIRNSKALLLQTINNVRWNTRNIILYVRWPFKKMKAVVRDLGWSGRGNADVWVSTDVAGGTWYHGHEWKQDTGPGENWSLLSTPCEAMIHKGLYSQ